MATLADLKHGRLFMGALGTCYVAVQLERGWGLTTTKRWRRAQPPQWVLGRAGWLDDDGAPGRPLDDLPATAMVELDDPGGGARGRSRHPGSRPTGSAPSPTHV